MALVVWASLWLGKDLVLSVERVVIQRTFGTRHGPITRLMSPGDLGQILKPFIFLDYVESAGNAPQFGYHPHSGIATLTFPLTFDFEHTASNGQVDQVTKGGIEWVMAGSGIWHKAQALNGTRLLAFQTWFALPPSHELAEPCTQFLLPDDVPRSGPVTVLLGEYSGMRSKISAPFALCYLWVELPTGERWIYQPHHKHDIAWVFVQSGTLCANGVSLERELAVFADGNGALHFHAEGPCTFLVASATRLSQSLSLGNYSVHSSAENLALGEARIAEIGASIHL
ncbi:MAG: hypothetical protein CFE35_15200 [Novosphingobium sp. PASSN1]|nr:MAG: hypothetical protein CFE35_15200 [Novosphingobium sp. PASSN1]